jgi:sigma-B regulation protein RsbU (phosphoserine phosphatase)
MPDIHFQNAAFDVGENSTLYIFSDGAYEINQPDGNIWGIDAFIDLLINHSQKNISDLNQVLAQIMAFNGKPNLDDDLSLLKVNFT